MADTLIRGGLTPDGVADVLVSGKLIKTVAPALTNDDSGTRIIDARGKLVWPGLINTHHHLAQSLLKGVPAGLGSGLDDWLGQVPFAAWPHLTPESLYIAARLGFAEMLRSGATTCVDHHYLYSESAHSPNLHAEMEAAIFAAASETGIRFVLARGGSTHAGTHAGQRSARMTESLDTCIKRIQETCSAYHDPDEFSMSRIAVAPTSLIHSSTAQDLKHLAAFAREQGLLMHSHLLEVSRDNEVALARTGMSAIEYAESVDWLGPDVWFAHLVSCDADDIAKLAASGTGVAHCPVSNCRLGSGIARIPEMSDAGMQVTLGVDGSASAESGSMVSELMQAWLIHRSQRGASATQARDVLRWATQSAANLLNLTTGKIQPGSAADLVIYDLSEPRYMGLWQREMAPVLCGEPVKLACSMVNGKVVVTDGEVLGIDAQRLGLDAGREVSRLQQLM